MKAFQLHDSQTEEIVGTVSITKILSNNNGENNLWEAWTKFNTSDFGDGEHDRESVEDFVTFFNEEHEVQIEEVEMDFIQPQ